MVVIVCLCVLFCYVRFTPLTIPLPLALKPFIPDMVPAVPDVDAMIKVPIYNFS